MVEKIKNLLKDGEFIRYVMIGGLTTVVDFGLFAIFTKIFGWDAGLSNVISIVLSIAFSYIANKIFVFKTHCKNIQELWQEIVKFVSSRIGAGLLEIFLVWLMADIMGFEPVMSKLSEQIIVFIINYLTSKFWAFKAKE